MVKTSETNATEIIINPYKSLFTTGFFFAIPQFFWVPSGYLT